MKKAIVITGASSGIGKARTKLLLEQGHHKTCHGNRASFMMYTDNDNKYRTYFSIDI